ncbi:MAG: response regulator [Myxococcota bacterium]|nr:response regulator [Myxococcota bacterium]
MDSLKEIHVGIIEDNHAARAALKAVLHGLETHDREFRVHAGEFPSSEALFQELAQGYDAAIYFVDIHLPGVNGLELAVNIKQNAPQSQIIFLSNDMNSEIDEMYKELGDDFMYYQKPMMYFEIISAVNYGITAWKNSLAHNLLFNIGAHHTDGFEWIQKINEIVAFGNIFSSGDLPEVTPSVTSIFEGLSCAGVLLTKGEQPYEAKDPDDLMPIWSSETSKSGDLAQRFLDAKDSAKSTITGEETSTIFDPNFILLRLQGSWLVFLPIGKFTPLMCVNLESLYTLLNYPG